MNRRRGMIRIAILHLLKEEPMHGYRIMKELEKRADGFYTASAGTIYPALQDLLKQDKITFESKSSKKTYFINENGETHLEAFISKRGDDFWNNWKERWIWRSSEKAAQLYDAIESWESELRKTIRHARKHPDKTDELTHFIKDITTQLKKKNE